MLCEEVDGVDLDSNSSHSEGLCHRLEEELVLWLCSHQRHNQGIWCRKLMYSAYDRT